MKIQTKFHQAIKFSPLSNPNFNQIEESVIFFVNTDQFSEDEVLAYNRILTESEREVASRFRFLRDRNSYIVTHAILRIILGNHFETEPTSIEFKTNFFGKPSVQMNSRDIHFNLSHSSGLSALAFSDQSEVGIDIERIDPEFDFDLIVNTQFSEKESRYLKAVEPDPRKTFYILWTRKEAILKTLGTGIGENLDIEVFRDKNFCNSENLLPAFGNKNYFLSTFIVLEDYIVTIAAEKDVNFTYKTINLLEP